MGSRPVQRVTEVPSPAFSAMVTTQTDLLTDEFLIRLRTDLPFYSAACLRIRPKELEGSELPWLEFNSDQALLHERISKQRRETGRVRAIILKARQLGTCLDPETSVLTADLRWVRIDDLTPGVDLLACDEDHPKGSGSARKLRRSTVVARADVHAEAFRLVLEDGRTLIATARHRFLTRRRGGTETCYRMVENMKSGDVLRHITQPWGPAEYEDGWFGGFADGEGCLRQKHRAGCELSVSQLPGPVFDRAVKYLDANGYTFRQELDNAERPSKFGRRPVAKLVVGRIDELLHLIGKTQPSRWMTRDWWEGKDLPGKSVAGRAWVRIKRIEPIGPRRMVDLQTTTKTFVAEGVVSHNSTYVAARFYRGCHLWSHRHALVLADELKRAGELHQMYERYDSLMPAELQIGRVTAQRKKELALSNGSQVAVETAGDVDAGRSTTLQYVHASEMALWPHADDTFLSLMNAVPDSGSEVIIESTAKGVGNAFHRRWLEAESGDSGWLAIFLPWWIHSEYSAIPSEAEANEVLLSLDEWEEGALTEGIEWEGKQHRLTVGQLLWRRKAIADKAGGDERLFRQEYPSTAEEAFLVSGNPFFSEDSLTRYARSVKPPQRYNIINVAGGIALDRASRGYLRVWRPPEHEQPCIECKGAKTVPGYTRCPTCGGRGTSPTLYVIGADTAEGKAGFMDPDSERGGTDFNSATVFEVNSRSKVAEWHGRSAPEVFATELFLLGNLYGSPDPFHVGTRRPALLGVERNHSSGQTVLRILSEEHRYPNLFVHRWTNRRTNEITEKLGWVTDGETRPLILDGLAQALREDSIEMPSKESVTEYRTFVRDDKGKPQAQEGCHDDRVISDAIALEMLRRAPRAPTGSFPETETADTPTGL